jgi:hypothetical protein
MVRVSFDDAIRAEPGMRAIRKAGDPSWLDRPG